MVLAVAAVVIAACSSGSSSKAVLAVTPARALFDTPVTVSVSGAPAGKPVTFTAIAKDGKGVDWTATATITADGHGSASTAGASNSGSYAGVNPMGIFELQAPTGSAADTAEAFVPPASGWRVRVSAVSGGRSLGSADVTRLRGSDVGVTEKQERLDTAGVYGDLFLPKDTSTRHPAVLVFGGSEGGLDQDPAASTLAAHGYPALSLAYFKEPGLPATLARVPLEYFAKALTLLAAQSGVDPAHMLTWGISRGSEAAQLLGVDYPALVHGVIAAVPSSVVNGSYPGGTQAAWTLHGADVPWAPLSEYRSISPSDPNAIIAVDRIAGPMFTVCGGEDNEWPSCTYSDAITARLAAHHNQYPHIALHYPDAGHSVGTMLPYAPTTVTGSAAGLDFGGTLPSNLAAKADAWPKLLRFLAAQ